MWITYFNSHFCISEMPTISMGKLENYSFVKEQCEALASLFFGIGFAFLPKKKLEVGHVLFGLHICICYRCGSWLSLSSKYDS